MPAAKTLAAPVREAEEPSAKNSRLFAISAARLTAYHSNRSRAGRYYVAIASAPAARKIVGRDLTVAQSGNLRDLLFTPQP